MLDRFIALGLRDCDVNFNRRMAPEDMERMVRLHADVAEKAFRPHGADLTAACRIEAVKEAYAEWIRKEKWFPRAAEMLPYFQANIHPVRRRQALPGQHATPDRPAGHPLWPAMIAGVRRGNAAAAAWVFRMQRSLGLPGTIPVTCDAAAVADLAGGSLTTEDLAAMAGA